MVASQVEAPRASVVLFFALRSLSAQSVELEDNLMPSVFRFRIRSRRHESPAPRKQGLSMMDNSDSSSAERPSDANLGFPPVSDGSDSSFGLSSVDESTDDVVTWLGRLHHVDDKAAEKIWNEYFPKLARLARARLGTLPRRAFDEEDIAISALKSFFRGAGEGRFQLRDRDDLWKLLVTITVRKVTAERRRFFADKRGGGNVRGDSVFYNPNKGDQQMGFEQVLDENRMPEFVDDVVRACEDLLGMLNKEALRNTALMKMEGHTNQEISTELGCSVARTKQRLSEIRRIWQDALSSR